MLPQTQSMTASAQQAAAELSGRLGLPVDFATAVAASDRLGAFIRVMVAPEFTGRLSLPPVFKGFRVLQQRGFAA